VCGLRRGRTTSDISIYFYLIYLYSSTGIRHGSIGGGHTDTDRAIGDVASVVPAAMDDLASVVPAAMDDLASVVPAAMDDLAGLPLGYL